VNPVVIVIAALGSLLIVPVITAPIMFAESVNLNGAPLGSFY
jgi:hypothetical protein